MTKSRGILGPRHKWTDDQIQELRRRYPDERAQDIASDLGIRMCVIYAKAKKLGLSKSEAFKNSESSGRLNGVRGAESRFKKGNVPWTKGIKGLHISPATEFKKGERPANYMEVGSEKMHMGYVWLKIADGGWPEVWRPKHHVLWERHHGKTIPPGHMLSFRDRNARNFDMENLELVSRVDWMKRHTLHNYPQPLPQLILLRGALNRQINKRSGK